MWIRIICTLSALVVAFSAANLLSEAIADHPKPNLPKDQIPNNIPADVKDAILQLYAADAVKRGAAAHRLGELGQKSALPYLIGLLHDGTGLKWQRPGSLDYTRTSPGREAAESIAKIGGEQATAGVVESVMSDNRIRRENAIVALFLINDPKTAEIAVVALGDDSWFVRERSANLLGRWKYAKAFDDLVKLLKDDKSAGVRATAAESLGKIGDTRAIPHLSEALGDKGTGVQRSVMFALCLLNVDRDKHVETLTSQLLIKETWNRYSLVRLLGNLHDPKVVDAFIDLLEDKETPYYIREAAYNELELMTEKDFADDPKAWRLWWKTSGRDAFEGDDK